MTEVRSGREWVHPLAVVTTRARIGNASARFHAHLYQAAKAKVNVDFLFQKEAICLVQYTAAKLEFSYLW